MAEPTTSFYPDAFDNDLSLYGDLQDQRNLSLIVDATDTATTLYFDGIEGVDLPTYILFMDGEIIYVEATNFDKTAFVNVLRGACGSTPIAHSIGSGAYLVLTAKHINVLKNAALIAQKFHGLFGLDEDKPATPEVGMIYNAQDTKLMYCCTQAGVWSVFGGRLTHSELLEDGETDDHPQYLNAQRALDWHSVGGHVVDGDAHDHRHGTGAGRINSGLKDDKPSSFAVGEAFLAIDTGELLIAKDNASWGAVTGAPQGMIAIFLEEDIAEYGNQCPPGWVRYSAMDGMFPKGAPSGITAPLEQGGMNVHTHVYNQVPSHNHGIPQISATTTSSGSHSHNFPSSTTASGEGLAYITNGNRSGSVSTSSDGEHTHSMTVPASTTGNALKTVGGSYGENSAITSASEAIPPFQEVVFCQKV